MFGQKRSNWTAGRATKTVAVGLVVSALAAAAYFGIRALRNRRANHTEEEAEKNT